MPVLVVNVKYYRGRGSYIGRSKDPKQAVFGNPFTHLSLKDTLAQYHVPTREEAIRRYKEEWVPEQWANNEYFRLALSSLVRRHLRGETVVLACHCAPLPCHGDVLSDVIVSLADMGVVTLENKVEDEDGDKPF